MSSGADPRIGQVIEGRYRVRELLGKGGMGVVYAADHLALAKPVAIKFLTATSDHAAKERFQREARAASKIDHDNVISIFDASPDYIVMEYVEGPDLRRVLDGGPLAIDRVIRIGKEILAGLQAIHDAGIVHRDIKPANIVLEPTPKGERAKIMDFGIAKQLDTTTLTMVGHVMGTPQFMAPEQIYGLELDGRTDLYAVGVTLYMLLSGQLPFDEASFAKLALQKSVEPPRPIGQFRADVPPHLVAAITRVLAREPRDRFATANEFAAALDAPIVASPASSDDTDGMSNGTKFALLSAGAFAAVMLGLLVYTLLRADDKAAVATPTKREPTKSEPAKVVVAKKPEPVIADAGVATKGPFEGIVFDEPAPVDEPTRDGLLTKLDVSSNPPGAQVILNGRPVGTTPYTADLERGQYRIRLELAGYRADTKIIELESTPFTVSTNLAPR